MISDELKDAGFNIDIMEQIHKDMYGRTIQETLTKLTMLQGKALEAFIEELPPIGECMEMFV